MTLTTKTASTRNAFGERQFTETQATDDVVLQFVDRLEDPSSGNIRLRSITAVSDPKNLTPTVTDEATIDGVTYRILEVRPVFSKGVKIADKLVLQERA